MRTLAMIAIVLGCAGCGQYNQPQNPVTTDYPCGTRAHMCASKACCWNGQDCGGDVVSCPADMCCAAGLALSPDAGGSEPQWKPGTK